MVSVWVKGCCPALRYSWGILLSAVTILGPLKTSVVVLEPQCKSEIHSEPGLTPGFHQSMKNLGVPLDHLS